MWFNSLFCRKKLARVSTFLFLTAIAGNVNAAKDSVFYVNGKYLYDYDGEKVIIRGINEMVTWESRDGKTFPEIAQTGANCVRIVMETSDKALKVNNWIIWCYNNNMIPMLELHDATGKWSKLNELFDYWVNPEIVAVLKKHQKYILVNIGNEVGTDTVKAQMWVDEYANGIKRMRDAGINACLVVDATGYGQKIDVIISHGKTLLDKDPKKNILFSVHTWWPYSFKWTDKKVKEKLKAASDKNIAFIVGELGNKWDETSEGAIPYKLILEECQRLEIGWLAWSWGPGNNPQKWLDMTSKGTFETLNGWGLEVATTLPTSIKNTSIRPKSITNKVSIEPSKFQNISLTKADIHMAFSQAGNFIILTMPTSQFISVDMYDIRGRFVENYYNGMLGEGQHQFKIDSRTITNGIYGVRCSMPGCSKVCNIGSFK